MVLSGMNDTEMMADNIVWMENFVPLTETEFDAVDKVRDILRSRQLIQCTACNYCADECPAHIPISDVFACMNGKEIWQTWNSSYYYEVHTQGRGKASDCIACRRCEAACPQHLPISELMKDVSAEFDKEER